VTVIKGYFAGVLALLVLCSACGGDGPTGPQVSSVVLSRTGVKMLTDGSLQVDARPLDEAGAIVPDVTVRWTSTNPSVATVSASGLVLTLTPGTAFIRAEAGGASDSMRLQVAVSGFFTTVAAAGYRTCAITISGDAYCWGDNTYGGMGTGDTLSNPTPLAVRTSVRFRYLTLSQRTSCGIAINDDAYCWGANGSGQLGLGDTQDRAEPGLVTGGLKFSRLSAGYASTCGATTDGAGYCWGSNETGLLGDGLGANSSVPSPIAGGLTFGSLDVGHLHACGVTTAGAGYCWGGDYAGSLGTGTDLGPCSSIPVPCSATPIAVTGGLTFEGISAAGAHTCGITTAGAAYCWGLGGHLGDGTTETWNRPVAVTGGRGFTSLTTGSDLSDATKAHTCAIASGDAYCWGSNNAGQLGTGQTSDLATAPVLVSGGHIWRWLAAGADHSCGLSAVDLLLYCWGTAVGSLTPSPVPGQS
jgi:alpha-tubulin suppressor-like RCC1 family protein